MQLLFFRHALISFAGCDGNVQDDFHEYENFYGINASRINDINDMFLLSDTQSNDTVIHSIDYYCTDGSILVSISRNNNGGLEQLPLGSINTLSESEKEDVSELITLGTILNENKGNVFITHNSIRIGLDNFKFVCYLKDLSGAEKEGWFEGNSLQDGWELFIVTEEKPH